ncbi:MAG: IclR family transcriptional regulator [Candidatus Dormibacteraceae bacterium]
MARAKYPVKSLVKAMTLLDAVGKNQEGISIAALSQKLKIGKSTVHRLLATLRDFNLVYFDPLTSNYSLGAKILQWSESVTRQNLLLRLGIPVVRKLAEQSGETVNLAVLEGTEVMYLAQQESASTLRISPEIGVRLPSHCTALGKILLSDLSGPEFRSLFDGTAKLKALTPNSITDPDQLWEHLQKVGQERVAYDFEEAFEGGICVGALVRNHTGRGVAALSTSMPKQRLNGERLMRLREYVLEACEDLSRQLGYCPSLEMAMPELPAEEALKHAGD